MDSTDCIVCLSGFSAILYYNNLYYHHMQLSDLLMRTEAELKAMQLSQARSESTNSAKLAAQSAG